MPQRQILKTPDTIIENLARGAYPRVYVNACTHGDERVGYHVLKALQTIPLKRGTLVLGIANARAFKENRRYIDQDLNRSFPGKIPGNHEEALAHKLRPAVQIADIVIDIHSTESTVRDSIIAVRTNRKVRKLINFVQPKYALYMRATKSNALISAAKVGIAFEYGNDKDPRTLSATTHDILRILDHLRMTELSKKDLRTRAATEHYLVKEVVEKPAGYTVHPSIENFVPIKKGQIIGTNGAKTIRASKSFYPILFGKNTYKTIFGFAASRMTRKHT